MMDASKAELDYGPGDIVLDTQVKEDLKPISNRDYMRLHYTKRWPYLKADLESCGFSKEQITTYYREFLSAQAYIRGAASSTAKFFEVINTLCHRYAQTRDYTVDGYALVTILSISFFASTQDRHTARAIHEFIERYNPMLQVLVPNMPLYSKNIPAHLIHRVLQFTGQEDLKHLMRAYVTRALYLLKFEGYKAPKFTHEEACRRFFVNYNLTDVMDSLLKVDIDLPELMKRFGKFVGKRSGVSSALDDGQGNEERRNSIFYNLIYERCRNLGVDITSDRVLDTFMYILFNATVSEEVVACYPTLQDEGIIKYNKGINSSEQLNLSLLKVNDAAYLNQTLVPNRSSLFTDEDKEHNHSAQSNTADGDLIDSELRDELVKEGLSSDELMNRACSELGKSRINNNVFNVMPCHMQFSLNQLDLFNNFVMSIGTEFYNKDFDGKDIEVSESKLAKQNEVFAYEKRVIDAFEHHVINKAYGEEAFNNERFQSVSMCPVRKGSASLPDEEQDIYSIVMMPLEDIYKLIGEDESTANFRREPLQKWQSIVRVRRTNLDVARKVLKRNVRYMVIRDYEDHEIKRAAPLECLDKLLTNELDICYFVTSLPCNHINFLHICEALDPLGNFLSAHINEYYDIDLIQDEADIANEAIHEFDVVKNTLQSTLRLLITRQRGDDDLVQVRLIRDALESDIYYVFDGVVLFALIFNHIWDLKISNSTEQFS